MHSRRILAAVCNWRLHYCRVCACYDKTMLRLALIRIMDSVCRWHPTVSFDVYVDDIDASAQGEPDEVEAVIVGVSRFLVLSLEKLMDARVSRNKSIVLASNKRLREKIGKGLEGLDIKVGHTAAKLGVDFSLRKARRVAKLRARLLAFRQKNSEVQVVGQSSSCEKSGFGATPWSLGGGNIRG